MFIGTTFLVWFFIAIKFTTSEYCYYHEGKEGRKNYLECDLIVRDQPIEGISLIHLVHNTTIPVIEKGLLSPFKNLKTVYITAANVDRIEPGALHNYRLEIVDLYHNNLKYIENGTFSSQNVLRTLDMSYNKFESLEATTFADLVALEWLSLVSNNIKTVDKTAFANVNNLKVLFLSFNKLEELELGTFDNLVRLEFLDLSFNLLKTVQFGLFPAQKNLNDLSVRHNDLENIEDHVFDNMTLLAKLDISQNQISELHENLFDYNKELQILKFNNNNISYFNATSLLAHSPKLEEIYLHHNQWQCDDLRNILDDFKEKHVTIPTSTPVLASDVYGIGCNE